ncbi:similar to Saccharomyces cerevisiae YGL153W PEX14 Peroxisomal membrane peroxin that is a central component of the peroxisomal protein import machinery [Maudiozyma barnettii]|uniref:Peroxisomal membrane protein PEX14 n=1 Tax=Maudiozyma barnettii TaxID=61262 RepID=A0A8H2VF96_9SACH|nr:Pex14p [Kazachstania barnettii]CAB4254516.1 similar to Saccharomyces cerevisiae YGL153W PEX14 Peroxisomal membrane peroxin that is a central component of the peroxisomal protein import machinery [Kazachstania barnettii]CAD1782543.1 similar to Saccharomyces cerevisiae YGL153W PEX14 Peroxisomal membrane peroxin that is a central component of the peroxisomal protein import machinery [Kazachstania barnettii]
MSQLPDTSERQKLFESAVSFLNDASVSDAPLAMKIKFLEKKGLNQDEIEKALKVVSEKKYNKSIPTNNNDENDRNGDIAASQSQVSQRRNEGTLTGERGGYHYTYQALPPVVPQRDWKDYFIMATATAGLFYGLFEVTKRYIAPNILPESSTKLEQDKEEIQRQFGKVDKLLETIDHEQREFREKETKKLEELDMTIADLQNTLEQTTQTRDAMENDFKMLKLELNNLQSAVDKFVSGNDTKAELNQMNNEILSLKHLIMNSSYTDKSLKNKKNNNTHIGTNNKSDIGTSTNPSHSIKSPINGLPGVEAIPSAAELLANMNFDTSEEENQEIKVEEPAWKKSRAETVSQLQDSDNKPETNNSSTDIPAWQAAMEAAQHTDDQ